VDAALDLLERVARTSRAKLVDHRRGQNAGIVSAARSPPPSLSIGLMALYLQTRARCLAR